MPRQHTHPNPPFRTKSVHSTTTLTQRVLHLLLAIIPQQLPFILINHSRISPSTPRKTTATREPLSTIPTPTTKPPTNHPPKTAHHKGHSRHHRNQRTNRHNRPFDPITLPGIIIRLSQSNPPKLAIPIPVCIPSDATSRKEGNDDSEEEGESAETVFSLEFFFVAGTGVHARYFVHFFAAFAG